MKVKVSSKSAAEQDVGDGEKAMTFMVYFQFSNGEHTMNPIGVFCLKDDFDFYKVGEKYEIK